MEPVVRYSLGKTPDGLSAVAPDKPLISVLFISDLLLMRAALCRLLEGSEIGLVGEVASCEEALSFTAAEHPHIVLVDLDSRADALACVRDLASSAEDSRIIVLTDRARTADIPTLMELGAAGVVLKHERPEVLIKAIRKVHAGEIWLDRVNTAQVLVRAARRRRSENLEAAKIAALTRREHEIIALVGEGLKNRLIAGRLFISEATVRNHLTSILDKLGVSDRFELAVYAYRVGLVHYPTAPHFDWVKSA